MVSCSRRTITMLVAVLFAVVFIPVQCTTLGGYQSINVSDKNVQKYADFAAVQLNSEMNNYYIMKKTKVLEASYRIVSGTNYYLKIELSPTVCTKSGESVEDIGSCKLKENSREKPLICDVVVWVQAWKKEVTMTDHKCSPESN